MATPIEAADLLLANKSVMQSQPSLKATWLAATSVLVESLQEDAQSKSVTSQAWLVANRAFFINNGAAPVNITYNGQVWNFVNADVYCCSKNELQFFLAESSRLGYSLAQSTVAAFVTDGVVRFFAD
jgi:hypothetical protein